MENQFLQREKLWRVYPKILENSFSGAFAGMETALPLHKKIKTGSYQIRVGNTYEVLGIAKCSREEIKRSEL
ncbi:MAG: hypothetical protein LKI59_08655 [Bacteroidales bacterium]|nr:hypothetical protein [Bacteroidales bacterium]